MKITVVAIILIGVLSLLHQPMWAAAVAALLILRWAFGHLFRSIRRRS